VSDDVAVAREIYEAFNRGDIARVEELMDPEVEWVEPQGYFVPEGRGVHRGRDLVMGFLHAFGEYWETFTVHPDRMWDGGDGNVLVWGRQVGRARATGRDYEGPVANLWVVRDGRAVRHESIGDSWSIAEALGGRPGG
jgi:ketosteroid isomerase-like protein